MHQSSSTTKRQKRKVYKQIYLLKIITTKLLLKDENGKVIADKKIRRFNS
jgi:hypothetical protein